MMFYSYMDKSSVLIGYLFSLALFLNFNSLLTLWIFMELNMLFFILLLNFFSFVDSYKTFKDSIIFYFFIQSLASFIFLFSLIYLPSFYTSSLLTTFSLLMKMGLPPFHFWVYSVKDYLNNFMMGILLTLQKFPLVIIMFNLASDWLPSVILGVMAIGSFFMILSDDVMSILIASSIYFSGWLLIFFLKSVGVFILTYITYSLAVFGLLTVYTDRKFMWGFSSSVFFCCLFLLGLPPVSLFFFKFYSFDLINSASNSIVLAVLIFSSFMGLLSYLKFFFTMFMNYEIIYKVHEKSFLKEFLYYGVFLCFFACLFF